MNKHPLANCEECPLRDRPIAPTSGPQDSAVILVSRSPGFYEAQAGTPFSGPSGDVLNHLLEQNGVNRKEIRLTNTVLCAPSEGKVPPKAIKCCSARLKAEVATAKLVIAAGAEAVRELTGMSIERARGYVHEENGYKLVATNNPALVLRDDTMFPNLVKDFKRAFHPLPPPTLPTVKVVEDANSAAEVIDYLRANNSGIVAADIESRGGLTHKATLISVQFAIDGGTAYVLGERQGLWADNDFMDDVLRPFFESQDYRFCWHNGTFDTKILRHTYGIKARIDEDTIVQSYVLDERPGHHALEYLLMEEFGWPKYEDAEINKIKKTGIVTNYDKFHEYAGWDVAGTYQLHEHQMPQIEEQGMTERPYRWPLMEATNFLRDVELNGFKYDVEGACDLYENELGPELATLIQNMRKMLDKPLLNPRSSVHVAALYYDEWKVQHEMRQRPNMGRSVDDSARKEIIAGRFTFFGEKMPGADEKAVKGKRAQIQKFTKMLDRYKKLDKQASQYIVGLVNEAIKDADHRIYTNLNTTRTITGRLSSTDPNLQNITRTKPDMPDIRRLFVAPPGRSIVNADYSQAELRVIACLSGDTDLLEIYDKGLDLHSIAAERFYGEEFVSEQRSKAKNMNFGVAFRQSAHTFQEKHGIPQAEAQRFIDWWWRNFRGVYEWEKGIERQVHDVGYLVSPFGRKRRFHLLTRENLQAIYREAINFLPQTSASDLTLTAGIGIHRAIDHRKAQIVLLVHDSIIAEVDDSYIDEYSTLCRQIMEERAKKELTWSLPFVVDVGVGPTWADAK